jgi:hypothetical protein
MPTCPNGHTSADADYCDECGAAIGGAAASAGVATAVATEEPVAPATQTCPQCGATRTGRFCEVDGYDFVAADLRGDQPATSATATGTTGGSGPGSPGAETSTGGPELGGSGASDPDGAGAVASGAGASGPAAAAPDGEPDGSATGGDQTDARPNGRATDTAKAGEAGAAGGGGTAGSGSGGPAAAHSDVAASTRWRLAVRADHDYHLRVLAMNGPDAEQMEFPKFAPERQFALQDDQVLVGRASRSRGIDPQIDLTGPPEDPGVSRSHAMLVRGADGWAVVDLDSANGTYLNGSDEPIAANRPVPLHDGDRIHVGAWTTLQLIAG